MPPNPKPGRVPSLLACLIALALPTAAQENDVTQTPNFENAGIKKSLTEQVGAGQGDVLTPDSSIFIVKRDPFRSIARGRQLFQRKFTVAQGFGPRTDDGVGNIETEGSLGAGLVDSCAGCHGRPRGSAGAGGNVFTRPDSRDAPHLFGLGLVEMLADEITADLRAQRDAAISQAFSRGSSVTEPLSSKGIDYGQVTAFPDGSVDLSAVEGVDHDLRVKPFFAEGSTFSMRDFIVGAFNAEMGLESPDPIMDAASQGMTVVTAGGLVIDGSQDPIPAPPVLSPSHDADGDGVVNEIDASLVDHMEVYLLNYFKPGSYRKPPRARQGVNLMRQIGCLDCHVQDLTIEIDRRAADVETVYDEANGVFNRLFATAAGLFEEIDDGSGFPTLKEPLGDSFTVENIFADFKRHDLGPNFWEVNFDGTIQKEFITEPLWGVGSTAPYGHDGRSINLTEVILRHGGEAQASRDAFDQLSRDKRLSITDFLGTLVLFPPPDTASNLDPGNPGDPDFPQRGHGSIDLSVLFNDPSDKE
jgi:hypothetical protein